MALLELDCAGRRLSLVTPQVMGVLNVTPDSFSDGGAYPTLQAAVDRAVQMVAEGAGLIDVGGESTRPGAMPVSVAEELRRVIPVITALREALSVPISIDSSRPEVMRAAVAAGAGLINDVRALTVPGAMAMAAALQVPVCLMHMQGQPQIMQQAPNYRAVVTEVMDFLVERIASCQAHGLARGRLIVDPGIGFGKTLAHNLLLIKNLSLLSGLGCPILIGASRKSMLGQILKAEIGGRLHGGVAVAVVAVMKGAKLVRTHDVAPTVEALRIVTAIEQAGESET